VVINHTVDDLQRYGSFCKTEIRMLQAVCSPRVSCITSHPRDHPHTSPINKAPRAKLARNDLLLEYHAYVLQIPIPSPPPPLQPSHHLTSTTHVYPLLHSSPYLATPTHFFMSTPYNIPSHPPPQIAAGLLPHTHNVEHHHHYFPSRHGLRRPTSPRATHQVFVPRAYSRAQATKLAEAILVAESQESGARRYG
jgi:hypothetical protein